MKMSVHVRTQFKRTPRTVTWEMGDRGAKRLNTVIFLYSNYAISKLREYANHLNMKKKKQKEYKHTRTLLLFLTFIHSGFVNCYEHANTHLEIIAQFSWIPNIDVRCRSVYGNRISLSRSFGKCVCVCVFYFLCSSTVLRALILALVLFRSFISCRYLARVASTHDEVSKNIEFVMRTKLIARSLARRKTAEKNSGNSRKGSIWNRAWNPSAFCKPSSAVSGYTCTIWILMIIKSLQDTHTKNSDNNKESLRNKINSIPW